MSQHTNIDGALKLWVVMNRALRSISERLEEQVGGYGLSLTEFGVLEVLFSKGNLPVGEIGRSILLTSGSMTYVIDKLVKRGLISRIASETDRRVIIATLTEEGRILISEIMPEHIRLIEDLTAVLSTDEKGSVTELLKRVGKFAQEMEEQQSIKNVENY